MTDRLLPVLIIVGLFAEQGVAHHSVRNTYDSNTMVNVQGSVTRISYTNPHVWIELSAKKDNGEVVTQRVEFTAMGRLLRTGFDRNLLNVGDRVTVEVWLARNRADSTMNGRSLTLSDGRKVDIADNWP